uniref:Uncharacterized protein n=1 Tax=Rhizophora mucronata TaxID=61149 RepID=A0A2P2JDS8_RHIMU
MRVEVVWRRNEWLWGQLGCVGTEPSKRDTLPAVVFAVLGTFNCSAPEDQTGHAPLPLGTNTSSFFLPIFLLLFRSIVAFESLFSDFFFFQLLLCFLSSSDSLELRCFAFHI